MRIDPILLIAVLVFCGLLAAFLLASSGKGKKAVAQKRLQALAPARSVKAAAEPETASRKATLLSLLPAGLRARMRKALYATGGKLSFDSLILAAIAGGALVALLAIVVIRLPAAVSAMAVVVAMLVVPWFLLRTMQARHKSNFLRLFPDAIDLIVRAVRAGLPVSAALDAAGRESPDPVGVEFRRVLADLRIGLDLDEGLARAARRIRLVDFDFFVASLVLQRKSGGNLAETLAILSSVLRRREELRSKTKAMTSEARTSALVLGALPFFAGGAIVLLNPQYFGILFTDPRGAYVMGGGLASLSLGILSMRILIQKALT